MPKKEEYLAKMFAPLKNKKGGRWVNKLVEVEESKTKLQPGDIVVYDDINNTILFLRPSEKGQQPLHLVDQQAKLFCPRSAFMLVVKLLANVYDFCYEFEGDGSFPAFKFIASKRKGK